MFTLEQTIPKDFHIRMTNSGNQDRDLGQTEVLDIAFIFIFVQKLNTGCIVIFEGVFVFVFKSVESG